MAFLTENGTRRCFKQPIFRAALACAGKQCDRCLLFKCEGELGWGWGMKMSLDPKGFSDFLIFCLFENPVRMLYG